MREIIFDTETTGFDPRNGDRLVEIGCVELIDRRETGVTFHAYFNPERDMPAAAEAVHGLSIQFLSDKPLFATRVDELIEFLGDAPLVAHNAAFDFGFVNAEFARAGRPALDMARMCCTVQMARKLHPGAKHSLDALCTRYGIDRSLRIKHGALIDAQLLAQCYVELTGGRQIGLEPVFTREGSRFGDADELVLKLRNFFLDLVLVDAVFRSGNELGLDFLYDLDGRFHTGIGRVDLGGAEAEGVLDGGKRHVVRTHRGRDRPVSGVVRSFADAQAGRNAGLRIFHAAVDGTEGGERSHCCDVRKNAGHERCPLNG